jgi:regulator of G-protein signaling
MFEKAQSQIFQLMKYDSYTRFLKSNMYKDCIMNEMEGKSIPYTKQQLQLQLQHQQQHHQTSSINEDKSKALDSLV